MKRSTFLYIFTFAFFILWSLHSCKKETIADDNQQQQPPPPPPPVPPVTSTYVEEFRFDSMDIKGWKFAEFSQADSGATLWSIGAYGPGKVDTTWYGFYAYSNNPSNDYGYFAPDEYTYSYEAAADSNLSISSWMLTPVLTVKNGDSISFYTRGDTTGTYTNRMQVLLSPSGTAYVGNDLNSVGDFTQQLFDINPTQAPGGYPTAWTRYVYTFTGVSGTQNIRIGFRHYVIHPTNARGIGIDQFTFGVK